ncbi:hypothetical protein C8Q74DRAFT_791897 [Fomes fomentarius]|nr:hypothetical protein C8Q74DRAFT_791897 [Fomes fomentarius]
MEPYGSDGSESECNCNDSDDSWGSDMPWDAKPAVSRDTSFKAWKRLVKAKRSFLSGEYGASVPFFVKSLEDPDNVIDVVKMVKHFPDKGIAMQLLLRARDVGRVYLQRGLGADCFNPGSSHYGQFRLVWGAQRYLKTLLAISQVAIDGGDYSRGIDASSESLRLAQDDYIGQRHMLSTLLLKAGRYAEALRLCQYWLDPNLVEQSHWHKRLQWHLEPPSMEPLNGAIIIYNQRYESEGACELFNAALAAFRTHGDCELARQCLRVGTEVNPQIMMRVLARVERPNKPYRRTRHRNRRDDAHDYRWLAQDLWMEDDVWEWANNDQEVRTMITKRCHYSGCRARETRPLAFRCCSDCSWAYYCSRTCQKAHWSTHKTDPMSSLPAAGHAQPIGS